MRLQIAIDLQGLAKSAIAARLSGRTSANRRRIARRPRVQHLAEQSTGQSHGFARCRSLFGIARAAGNLAADSAIRCAAARRGRTEHRPLRSRSWPWRRIRVLNPARVGRRSAGRSNGLPRSHGIWAASAACRALSFGPDRWNALGPTRSLPPPLDSHTWLRRRRSASLPNSRGEHGCLSAPIRDRCILPRLSARPASDCMARCQPSETVPMARDTLQFNGCWSKDQAASGAKRATNRCERSKLTMFAPPAIGCSATTNRRPQFRRGTQSLGPRRVGRLK